ncbi:diguanylate cyclase (GGDEF) domain-containing protein [Selenomonas ruminantium]|uniref:Diguanylate cyclase (GGDEF) domain-containing protein n=1 Tax=Selenomonas ruminantium TaxID=971 RepID=A0A1M6T697_SELRU|nr:EAL domain-containing protein [Selenomonas ruminantium]SHK52505.1 diguanylate cyclase (GGDEF) domain-containing protein [Selenomonas ruminantium]
MVRCSVASLANDIIREYYEFGDTNDICHILTDDVIFFGLNTQHYVQGKEQVIAYLHQNADRPKPIHIRKLTCGEVETDQGITVRANIDFCSIGRKHSMHRIMLMFRKVEDEYKICGINVQRGYASFFYNLRYDRLTNLYNKKAFCQRAAEIITQHPEKEFEIMRFNIARFKVINDLFGEETGDKLLKYVAEFLTSIQLEPCVYGRLYADNFLLCYPTAGKLREHLIHSLQMLAVSFALDYRIDFYFGVYTVKERDLSVTTMLDRAAMGLFKASRNGLIVCGEYEDDMRETMVNEQVIVNNMNGSLEREEFIVYLQPKYDLNTEKIMGAEALVRWVHPQLGFISPAKFVPIFEQNGFIYQLDKYVWEKTCQLLREDIDAGRPVLPVSINVSRVDFYSPNLVQIFEELTEKYNLNPRFLELELTESAYVENPQQIIEITRALQEKGFVILMDDFGSGYSSLNMLKDLPVDILKIDLKFLANSQGVENGRADSILNSVVRMAKRLAVPVIAEGVENQEQVDFLRTIGCEYAQGYFYSEPVPLDDYRELLRNDFMSSRSLGAYPENAGVVLTLSKQLRQLMEELREIAPEKIAEIENRLKREAAAPW